MQALMILYRSALDLERVTQLFRDRVKKYRTLPGLAQKFYVHDPSTGEVGGIYIFDNRQSLDAFLGSGAERDIRETYRLTDAPLVRVLDIVQTLHEHTADAVEGR